ncbi:hypothetical protein Clacol_009933 [Clathrus columnatus]|uniref:CRAL-TRIO domain-containing protein n=1 Tax=Clathrus columnatus TaxID=1419009 RepID=A0AAV5AUW8_9AGAM|nr:hypothetical protein Clacol_009933 [Clathrus columnatus]
MIKEHEREKLEQFRKEVMSEGIVSPGDTIGTDDMTFLRFLRARKLNIKDTKKMIANCQEWRKTVEGVGMDALYEEIDPLDYPERELVSRYWPLYFHKEGHPINIQSFGGLDVNTCTFAFSQKGMEVVSILLYTVLQKVDGDRQWKAFLTNCDVATREIFPACSRAKGSPISSSFCIVDLKGFGLQKFWSAKSHLRAGFQIAQDYYPEAMARLAIINAPASFTIIWAAVKPWLAPETIEKVVILGEDYKKYLLEYIDAENLPAEFGGTCTCEGIGGCVMGSAGPWLDGRVWNGHGPSKFKPKQKQELTPPQLEEM